MRGNRRVKAATEAFRRSFAEAAVAALAAQQRGGGGGGGNGGSDVAAAEGGEQRSAEWFKLRERRLTASAFSKALGLFSGGQLRRGGQGAGRAAFSEMHVLVPLAGEELLCR